MTGLHSVKTEDFFTCMGLVKQRYKSSLWKVEKLVKQLLKLLITAPEATVSFSGWGKCIYLVDFPLENSYTDAEQPQPFELQIYFQ